MNFQPMLSVKNQYADVLLRMNFLLLACANPRIKGLRTFE